ncbi:MAG TPA: hypothetical protein VFS52_03455 [Steroidobacteraceae bacterium]|nr:hypothetical protein [Steroidobacteraceae bacterium]
MPSRAYLMSLPERVIRSALGLSAGLLREVGEVVLPRGVRHTRLYKNLVDTTLRFVIEEVGGAKNIYPAAEPSQLDNFLVRRSVGNAVEVLGIVAFRVSPVWVLAALADLSGLGRRMIPEIAAVLEKQGLLEPGAKFENVDQLLDGLERTSARLAETFNTPPLDVASLRQEWAALRAEARGLKPTQLPSPKVIGDQWEALKQESARQGRSVFETSSIMAVSAVRALPGKARRLTASARVGAVYTGKVVAAALLDHYSQTLKDLGEVGYLNYAKRQLSPYLRACVGLFSREQRTLTERLLEKMPSRKK